MTETRPPMLFTRRRFLLAASLLTAALATGLRPAAAQVQGAEPFVKSFASQLVGIVNSPQSEAAKQAALGPVIDQNVDVPAIARFCLGRFWSQATPAQQQEYVALFHKVLLRNITGHLGEYRGVTYQVTGTRNQGGEELVGTTIDRPQQQPIDVEWVVSGQSGAPKVVDVIAEGTSLRLTQRQDYASYLSRHSFNIDTLIAALRRQLART